MQLNGSLSTIRRIEFLGLDYLFIFPKMINYLKMIQPLNTNIQVKISRSIQLCPELSHTCFLLDQAHTTIAVSL